MTLGAHRPSHRTTRATSEIGFQDFGGMGIGKEPERAHRRPEQRDDRRSDPRCHVHDSGVTTDQCPGVLEQRARALEPKPSRRPPGPLPMLPSQLVGQIGVVRTAYDHDVHACADYAVEEAGPVVKGPALGLVGSSWRDRDQSAGGA